MPKVRRTILGWRSDVDVGLFAKGHCCEDERSHKTTTVLMPLAVDRIRIEQEDTPHDALRPQSIPSTQLTGHGHAIDAQPNLRR